MTSINVHVGRRSRNWRRLPGAVVVTGLIAAGVAAGVTSSAHAEEPRIAQQLAVASYIHPAVDAEAWDRLIGSAPGTVGIAVANVVNGPDYLPVTDWTSVIQKADAAGIRMLAYVDTGYLGTTGQRTRLGSSALADWISQIQRDIDAWYTFYGPNLGGIFFDQGQNVCGPAAGSNAWAELYREVSEYVKRNYPGAMTVSNPGTTLPQCYENSADVLITFENSYTAYTEQYFDLGWEPVDPNKIWHIVYGASTQEQMETAMALSKTRGAGYVYVTDDVLANPYDTLPPPEYWNAQQAAIAPSGWPTADPPLPPQELWDEYTTSNEVLLAWWVEEFQTTAPVVGYDVFRDGVWIGAVRGDVTTFTATALEPKRQYSFTVVARDASGKTSDPSPTLQIVTSWAGSRPVAPAALVASSTSYTSTTLSWSTPVLTAKLSSRPPAAAYEIYQNDNLILRLPATTSSVTVGSLAPASVYTFSVRAVSAAGAASWPTLPVLVTTSTLPGGRMIDAVAVTESAGAITYSAEFLVPFAFRRVFIATGAAGKSCWWTGSKPQLCADYVIENERLLAYAGDGIEWKWQVVRNALPAVDGFTYAWTIEPADIGGAVGAIVAFNANGNAPNTYCGPTVACVSNGPALPYEIGDAVQWSGEAIPVATATVAEVVPVTVGTVAEVVPVTVETVEEVVPVTVGTVAEVVPVAVETDAEVVPLTTVETVAEDVAVPLHTVADGLVATSEVPS